MNTSRRHWLRIAVGATGAAAGGITALGLAGCAGVFGPPSVTLSPREIDRLLARQFPLERRVLEVVDVTLDTPSVRLLPERNRLAVALDLAARDRVLGGRWRGRLEFDAALRWEAADRSVRLAQVRVQDFRLDGNPGATRSGVERLGGALFERLLEDRSLYSLPEERAERLRQAGYAPSRVDVTDAGIEIAFVRTPP